MFEPFQIGRYHCYEQLGEGPHTEVVRAKLIGVAGFERHFAIKRLRPPIAKDSAARRRFVVAGKILIPLEDARLVKVFDAQDGSDGCYVVSECVQGVHLGRALEEVKHFGEDTAAYLAAEVARALASLASKRRAHGALVCSNVLLTGDGEVRLSDAGLRVALSGATVEADADARALGALVEQMMGAPPQRAELVQALAKRPIAMAADEIAKAGDASRGKSELAAAVRKALHHVRERKTTHAFIQLGPTVAQPAPAPQPASLLVAVMAKSGPPAALSAPTNGELSSSALLLDSVSELEVEEDEEPPVGTSAEVPPPPLPLPPPPAVPPPIPSAAGGPRSAPLAVNGIQIAPMTATQSASAPPPTGKVGSARITSARLGSAAQRASQARRLKWFVIAAAGTSLAGAVVAVGLLRKTASIEALPARMAQARPHPRLPTQSAASVAPPPVAPKSPPLAEKAPEKQERAMAGTRPELVAPAPSAAPAPTPARAPEPQPSPVAAAPEVRSVAPAMPGAVAVTTDPEGAALYVDREPHGNTPATLSLSPGTHRLVLLRDGSRLVRQSLHVPPAGTQVQVALPPAGSVPRGTTGIKVRCHTPGLHVFVDDVDTGQSCPTERIDLAPGAHKVGIYVPWRDDFSEKMLEVPPLNYSTRVRFSE